MGGTLTMRRVIIMIINGIASRSRASPHLSRPLIAKGGGILPTTAKPCVRRWKHCISEPYPVFLRKYPPLFPTPCLGYSQPYSWMKGAFHQSALFFSFCFVLFFRDLGTTHLATFPISEKMRAIGLFRTALSWGEKKQEKKRLYREKKNSGDIYQI